MNTSSKFNTLYRGEPHEAANILEDSDDIGDLRVALINALRRIAALEEKLAKALGGVIVNGRRVFTDVSAALRKVRTDRGRVDEALFHAVCQAVAGAFAGMNKAFDRDRFMADCGVPMEDFSVIEARVATWLLQREPKDEI